jgi:hydroxymethylpyrimidine/phosphomethylpyrimidine kinase
VKPLLLLVGGHDPSGAGVDADRAAAASFGDELEVRCETTAWTRQDAGGLRELGARAAEDWARPVASWLAEARAARRVVVLKFGLLPTRAALDAAAALLADHAVPAVVDPVLAPSAGGRFLEAADVEHLRRVLLSLPVVATPNVPELAELLGRAPEVLARDPVAREVAARALVAAGCRAVVAKGGHGVEDPALDLVVEPGGTSVLEHPRLPQAKVRGSGCRHATVLAGHLALGKDLPSAARKASEHLLALLRRA